MNAPSSVSMRLMPAANRIGSDRIARIGTEWVATPAASARRPTSVAVSNPRPKSSPSGYICQLWSMRRKKRPKKRLIIPRSSRRFSRRSRSYAPPRISRKMRMMSTSTIRFRIPMIHRNVPETDAPM